MAVSITINGLLTLDQTAGLQADDVDVTDVGGVLAGLDADFLTFLNGLSLTTAQKDFAALVDGASEPDLVSVVATAGETIKSVFFSDAQGNDFHGTLVAGVTTLDGSPLYLWSMNGGAEVIVTTSNVSASAGTIAAAFFIESNNAANTEAKVQSITFLPLLHPDATDPNDSINFTDILKVSASVVISTPIGGDIIVNDDGPTIVTNDHSVNLTVDESALGTDATANFAGEFTKTFGTDGKGTDAQYSLSTSGGPSGLTDTATGQSVVLSLNGGVVEGRTSGSNDLVFTVSVAANGDVTLDQKRAVVHTDTTNPNDSTTLLSDGLVQLNATITDGDGDPATAALNIGQNLLFLDDGPSISPTGTPPTATVDETTLGTAAHADYGPLFTKNYGADGGNAISFSLDFGIGAVGLLDEEKNQAISLSKSGGVIFGKDTDGDTVFSISVSAAGDVVFTQLRSVVHDPNTGPDQTALFASAGLISLTATITDGDGDQASSTLDISKNFAIKDDAPTLTVPVDYPGTDTFLKVGNAAGQHNTGSFGYNIGADDHTAAFYAAGGSDFVDSNPSLAGVQIGLTGTVSGPPSSAITNAVATLFSEDLHQATFNWSFHYDSDPITPGVQDATASGTLVFDKDADTFTITDTTPVIGFSFDVLHTSELVAKEPTSNVGHPNIVVETLVSPDNTGHNGFVVQFTGNNSPFSFSSNGEGSTADHTFTGSAHDMITSANETWVSATQSTNGVAGDTIQKGEALTLRFFDHSPGIATEALTPSAAASGVAVKFDGIGQSENLIVNLDLIDYGSDGKLGGSGTAADTTITRSIVIDNADIYKHADGVPAPYNTEFALDNNDGLIIIESNDYNATGEHYQIQGLQIMQSSNDLIGTGINLNRAIGAAGGSPVTGTQQSWGATDNDVLKITDIGFIQNTSGTQSASLDFAFNIADGDLDLLGVQHIAAQLSNGFIV
jgi:hypothetical protein